MDKEGLLKLAKDIVKKEAKKDKSAKEQVMEITKKLENKGKKSAADEAEKMKDELE